MSYGLEWGEELDDWYAVQIEAYGDVQLMATYDLRCPIADVVVNSPGTFTFAALGCGNVAMYHVRCRWSGLCAIVLEGTARKPPLPVCRPPALEPVPPWSDVEPLHPTIVRFLREAAEEYRAGLFLQAARRYMEAARALDGEWRDPPRRDALVAIRESTYRNAAIAWSMAGAQDEARRVFGDARSLDPGLATVLDQLITDLGHGCPQVEVLDAVDLSPTN